MAIAFTADVSTVAKLFSHSFLPNKPPFSILAVGFPTKFRLFVYTTFSLSTAFSFFLIDGQPFQ